MADNKHGSPGVGWHSGVGKYVARMMVAGKRVSLGYYATAEEAGRAYQVARKKTPPVEAGRPAVSNMRTINEAATLRVGQTMTLPDSGQVYTVLRVEQRTSEAGNAFEARHWGSHCRNCGEPFEAMTLGHSKGVIRTCEAHRWHPAPKAAPKRAKTAPKRAEAAPCPPPVLLTYADILGPALYARLRADMLAAGLRTVGDVPEYRAISAEAARLGCSVHDVAGVWELV